MAFRSVIDIDVNDSKFKDFQQRFEKYQAALNKLPAAWKKQTEASSSVKANIVDAVSAMMAQNETLAKSVRETERLDHAARGVERSFRAVLGTVTRISLTVAKWGLFTALGGGLLTTLGLGGLASSAYGMRRSAAGIGSNVGRERSFGLNYGQFVDPGFIGNIAGAQTDVSKRWAFNAIGVSGKGDPANVAASIIEAAHRHRTQLLSATGEQYAKAHGYLEVASMEELKRIANSSGGAIGDARRGFNADASRLDPGKDSVDAWANLNVQLRRTGMVLETTFMRALTTLAPGIRGLSESFARAVEVFLGTPKMKQWLDDFGGALERFAKYVGTSDFEDKIRGFVDNVGKLANAIGWLVGKLPDSVTGGNTVSSNPFHMGVTRFGDKPIHNLYNLRPAGDENHFMQYDSDNDGANAAKRQLLLYNGRGINTLRGIISKWAPHLDKNGKVINDTASYISDVSNRTGYSPDQKLNLNDASTMARVMTAMAIHEGHKVTIEINNNTGGNAVVSAAQAR